MDLLGGPADNPPELWNAGLRAREAFVRMVEEIIKKKEDDEREAERSAGTRH